MSEDNNSTGVTLPYEKQAMRGDPMPNGLNYPNQLLYQALALLYARYRMDFNPRSPCGERQQRCTKSSYIFGEK